VTIDLVREQDPRVPPDVERYLAEVFVRAAALGAGWGGSLGTGFSGRSAARGATRAAAWKARMIRTVVQDRDVPGSITSEELLATVAQAFPRAHRLPAKDGGLRLAIPVSRFGMQRVVVDVQGDPPPPGTDPYYTVPHGALHVRAYCKQGVIRRRLTAHTADRFVRALAH
jgi:hypothetical protein